MKNLLTIILFLFSASLLKAQDATLPKGSSTIYLHSGKTIKNVALWRIDSTKVEYVLNGNLADLKTMDVSKIETPDFLIEFDQKYQPMKKGYDIIVLLTKDTLRGFIERIDDGVIFYRQVGSDKVKRAMKHEVESYVQWREQTELSSDTLTYEKTTHIAYVAPAVDYSIVKEDSILLDAEDYNMAKDTRQEGMKETGSISYYHQSYERGVSDAVSDSRKSAGWGGGGFLLGMTIGSPFLSLGAANSKVVLEDVPTGVNDKLYRAGFENEIVKRRAKKAATGAIAGKILLIIIIIASF